MISAAQTSVCMAIAASMVAFSTASMVSLAKPSPRSSQTRRIRRLSPQTMKNSGAWTIHGMPGISAPMRSRIARSRMRIIETCCRSDLEAAESAAASSVSSTAAGTGSSV